MYNLNTKTKMLNFEVHVLIGWLSQYLLASQSERVPQSQTFLC